jgi:hypothetical protein
MVDKITLVITPGSITLVVTVLVRVRVYERKVVVMVLGFGVMVVTELLT